MKMLLKRNLLECVTIISCGGCFFCIILNYVTNISPITGIWFPLYIILVFILAVSFSFKFIQWLLHMNKPLKYDLEGLLKDYPHFYFLKRLLPHSEKKVKSRESDEGKEYDTNELSVISTVLERKLVSSWYVPYISQEIGFPFACKQMLDQIIGKTFKICDKIETKEVFIDTCSILTSHLREYGKAVKRHEKSPSTPIETLYKKTHPVSDEKNKLGSAEHCTNILRIILRSCAMELWDTPHSELLVRILSKKLDSFIDSTLADPVWLNDKLLSIILNENESNVEDAPKVETEVVEKEKEEKSETTIESALSTLVTNTTAPILQRDINEEITKPQSVANGEIIESIEEATHATDAHAPVLRQRRGRRGRHEVKIYDRIIEGSVKTWETDMDLQCISLGQDLLASLDGEMALGRLWGADAEPDADRPQQQLWFGEEEALELEAESPPKGSPVKKEHSPKPAELLKDFQSTVHSAKTKIGGLQVPPRSLAPNDEAAGMMEGLLDFGIAGLKKGLRFTGLSDDSMDKSPSHAKDKSERNSPPDGAGGMSRSKPLPIETREPVMSSVIQKEDNGVSSVHTLVKQQRVASQDSVPTQPKPVPSLPAAPESPEPEYEEPVDLSASIAKLRDLLQQTSRSPERGEEVWWEGAEETRGRTQRYHSSRPIDTATLADEYDMNLERNVSPGQPNNMQRLDKLFQRTVTGVFNSIKTAVGAEGGEGGGGGGGGEDARPNSEWTYVCTSIELSVGGAVARLVGSRRAFTHVDAALDSLEHIMPPPRKQDIVPEDFEDWCCVYGGGVALAQLASASGLARSHVTHRLATLLLADVAESLIDAWLEQLASWLRVQVFAAFENMAAAPAPSAPRRTRNYDLEETCHAIMARVPVLYVFGEETLSQAVKLSTSSFGHKQLNKDIVFRILDLVAVHFKRSAGLRNPSFDAN
ncbi:uncharacterized protein isoform X2 [Choristoneura fumiferana]|uniref:uncharacterized protein isoform X2 n=1 Tax=Choristoneura fumiferana TaxID=7141 RepID=UPI003D15434B